MSSFSPEYLGFPFFLYLEPLLPAANILPSVSPNTFWNKVSVFGVIAGPPITAILPGFFNSETALLMVEGLLSIFETVVEQKTKKKTDFQKLLKQNFVENADRFAFLDPFAGEFDYSHQKITFSGQVSDQVLVQGVVEVVRKMAHDLGLFPALLQNLELWSEEYADELVFYDVVLTQMNI